MNKITNEKELGKAIFTRSLRQLLFSQISPLLSMDMTRPRVREMKRLARKTIKAEVKRLNLTEPEVGWKEFIKKIVDPLIDDMISRWVK